MKAAKAVFEPSERSLGSAERENQPKTGSASYWMLPIYWHGIISAKNN